MPDSCYAVGCSNRRSKGSALKFYRMSFGSDDKSLELRKKWVTVIKQDIWTGKKSKSTMPEYVALIFCQVQSIIFMLGIFRCLDFYVGYIFKYIL